MQLHDVCATLMRLKIASYLKDYKIISISPLPIYEVTREYKSDDEYHIIYKKIAYKTINP